MEGYGQADMIIGHLTTTYALATPLGRRFPALKNVPPLLVGAYLPDFIDKPLNLFVGMPTRGVGHSAILLTIVFYILIRALPSHRNLLIPLVAGAFLHLAQDLASPVVIFWPLFGTWEHYDNFELAGNLYNYYILFNNPAQFALEVLSYPFFAYALFRRYSTETIKGEVAPAAAMPE